MISGPLVLDHCEAFFLSYALGCLVVSDGVGELDLGRRKTMLNLVNFGMFLCAANCSYIG